MASTFEIKRVTSRPYIGIRRRGLKLNDIGKALGEMLPAALQHLRKQNIDPAGPPIALYHSMNQEKMEVDLQGGFFLESPIAAEAPFEAGSTPAGDAVVTVHVGPYSTIHETYAAACEWVRGKGRSTTDPAWELYLTDPGEVKDPAQWRTEVVWMLK